MGQSRFCDPALLYIEHKKAAKVDIEDLINDFANAVAGNKQF